MFAAVYSLILPHPVQQGTTASDYNFYQPEEYEKGR
jgi:hypothetical protein